MKKKEIYRKYATISKEDGTFSDYFKVYMKHPQQDEKVLIQACKGFSEYVRFCMGIAISYKSKNDGNYRQIAFDGDELDYEDYKIRMLFDSKVIYKDTDLSKIEYPNIEKLIRLCESKHSYKGIFNKLLNGEQV